MEGKTPESLQGEIFSSENLLEDFLFNEKLNDLISEHKIANKSVEELKQDEEMLILHLSKLKKENFELEITAKAWETTLGNLREELKEADLKLDEIHKEIQLEREKFFSKLDEFNEEYGIFSDWWKYQMNFIYGFENSKERNPQQKCKEDIKKLEEEIEELRKEIELLTAEKKIEIQSTQEESFSGNDDILEELSGESSTKKRAVEIDATCEESADNMYSLVDVEKVRMANRRRNQRKTIINSNK